MCCQKAHTLMNSLKTNNENPTDTIPSFEVAKEDVSFTDQELQPESVGQTAYELKYACLLIPRFPAHQLVGDLAGYLHQWLQQICVSYGWRLEFIEVNPAYLEYILCVNMSVSPDQFMKIIISQTSKLILSDFGRLRQEILSNDFWANGYLVVLGEKAIQEEMIGQFIKMCRRQQGLHPL